MNTDDRFARGKDLIDELMQGKGSELIEKMSAASQDLAALTVAFPFGEIYTRPGLDLRSRELVTLSALVVLGAWPQFKVHVRGALSAGCSETEIKELIIQLAIYAGFPAALNAMQAAGEVFQEVATPSTFNLQRLTFNVQLLCPSIFFKDFRCTSYNCSESLANRRAVVPPGFGFRLQMLS